MRRRDYWLAVAVVTGIVVIVSALALVVLSGSAR